MSEQNILNPNAASLLNPDYPYDDTLPPLLTNFVARSGETYTRQNYALGRIFNLTWARRSQAVADQLRQWEAQYRLGFFSFYHIERARYFTGRFAAPLSFSPQGNDQWDVKGQFVELCNKPMYQNPSNWARDAIFMESLDDIAGVPLIRFVGAWSTYSFGSEHGGASAFSNSTNDTAEWLYFGYSARVWSSKNSDRGIVEVSLDGSVFANVDLYSAVALAAAPIAAPQAVLGFHRLKLRVTGTKNGASSGYTCMADAIEVMQ